MTGRTADGRLATVNALPEAGGRAVPNYGFNVTPARLVTGVITDRNLIKDQGESVSHSRRLSPNDFVN